MLCTNISCREKLFMIEKNRLTFSILIPAHNEEKMISSCIQSCLTQTRKPDEIIVINDGSTDNTSNILRTYGNQITVVCIDKATGNKSKAQEIGVKYVTTDILIATDGDTILDEDFVKHIEEEFDIDREAAVVMGYVQSTRHNILTALREIDYTIGQDLYKRAQQYIGFILVIPGCAGAFKTELFRNGSITFDHDTLTEDLDFSYKINRLGLPVRFSHEAKVYTQDPPTLHSYINQMRRWYGGGWQNLKKHFPIIVNNPKAGLVLSAMYLEGLTFSAIVLITPFLNILLFLKLMIAYIAIGIVLSTYAAFRKKRLELFLVSPLFSFLPVINCYILVEQFIKEVIMNQKNMTWFHPERVIHIDKNKLAKL